MAKKTSAGKKKKATRARLQEPVKVSFLATHNALTKLRANLIPIKTRSGAQDLIDSIDAFREAIECQRSSMARMF
jgi:hypothetical protein